MKTYALENLKTNTILAYFDKLRDAKHWLSMVTCSNARIICIEGPNKYEGTHAYYMIFVNGINGYKFRRMKGHIHEQNKRVE